MPARKSPAAAPPLVKKTAPKSEPSAALEPTYDELPKGLTVTDTVGVFRNRAGVLVNQHGVAVSFATMRAKDDQRAREALNGADVHTPADFLDSVWKDPRQPALVRMDAAKASAPYRNQKLIGISGVAGGVPIDLSFKNDSDAELERKQAVLEAALRAAGLLQ
jgi:hypothetical protein